MQKAIVEKYYAYVTDIIQQKQSNTSTILLNTLKYIEIQSCKLAFIQYNKDWIQPENAWRICRG